MQGFIKNNKFFILLIFIIFFSCLPFFYMKQGLLLIDTGREFFIPQAMHDGFVLYKDIYNIYGPLSYFVNCFLMNIFGQNICVLYNFAIINSLLIIITLYLLGVEFIKKHLSFLFSAGMIFAIVYPVFLYNSNLTYSFAIVYALSSFLLSVLFLIKYTKSEKSYFAYFSCLFAGICISNKYEFFIIPLIILYTLLFVKPIGIKKLMICLINFLSVPLVCFVILLIQGLNFSDIKENIHLIYNLINAPIIKLFFSKTGGFFHFSYLPGLIKNNGIFSLFALLPLLDFLFLILNAKKIYSDKPLFILVLCSLSACAKSFLYLNIRHMGLFLFPICALCALILYSKYYKKFTELILLICIILFFADDFSSLKNKNYTLNTPKGIITTYEKEGRLIDYTCKYIFNNTKSEDKIVILPEGSIINYITDRKGDCLFYNLNPLFYKNVFGADKIIEHFNKNMPDYFIILPIDNIEYGSRYFGEDYAKEFLDFINNNFKLQEEKYNIKIFKRKNKE